MNTFALTRKCPAEIAQITCFFLVYGKILKFIFVVMTVVWASAHRLVAGEDTRYGLGSCHCICTGKMARRGRGRRHNISFIFSHGGMKHHRQHQRRLSCTTTAGAEFILIFDTILNVEKFRDEKITSV